MQETRWERAERERAERCEQFLAPLELGVRAHNVAWRYRATEPSDLAMLARLYAVGAKIPGLNARAAEELYRASGEHERALAALALALDTSQEKR